MYEALRSTMAGRARRRLLAERRAAVLVPIIDDEAGPRLLLTRRADTLASHTGQVAFPGGKVDPTDVDAEAAALREAQEEVGLPPDAVDVLGWLDDFPTIRATLVVTPVVGLVRALPPLRAEPGEVARMFTIPLSALRDPARWRWQDVNWRGEDGRIYFFDHDDETLWGLSARITLQVLQLTDGAAPIPLPGPW